MGEQAVRPNLTKELLRLRDFQRDTVETVFSRMYDPVAPARRFLVADEVGLGKTFVARGLIARIVDHLWDTVDRIDVVYICSNASIARQNIGRLTSVPDVALPSRITLLPTVIHDLEKNKLNLVSLTPQTSLNLRSSTGLAEERALLFWLLPEEWRLADGAVKRALQAGADWQRFRSRVETFDVEGIDKTLLERYRERLGGNAALRTKFDSLCDRFGSTRQNISDDDRELQRDVIGALRMELARSCLAALEPDLIILDEFQRFKSLLDGTDPAAELAKHLFEWGDVRVLLMSATPYKMFTTDNELDGDDHYRDFLQTIEFLYGGDKGAAGEFKTALSDYRTELLRISTQDLSPLRQRKQRVEDALRQVMVRTERLAVTADRNGMLAEVPPKGVVLRSSDVRSYAALSKVAQSLEHSDVIEYWKSAPFVLNFMDDYKLKEDFEARIGDSTVAGQIAQAVTAAPELLLSWDDVERYREIDPGNARLRAVVGDTLGAGMWRFLWLPPALAYYRLAGAFADADGASLTKRLIFSAWQVVPKVIASYLSYEAERLMFGFESGGDERPNTADARQRRQRLLRFSRSEGRLTGMPLFALLYPSVTLAEVADPLTLFRRSEGGAAANVDQVVQDVEAIVRPMVDALPTSGAEGAVDEAWYWAAPILLDVQHHRESTERWLTQSRLPERWRNPSLAEADKSEADQSDDDGNEGWRDHVAEAQRLLTGRRTLGARPPDLASVVAKIALGAPATVALRALSRVTGGTGALERLELRNEAAGIGWAFRSLFNLPEVTSMIRGLNSEESYWQRVIEYGVDGCLQGVLDEFAHVLLELEGASHLPAGEAARRVGDRIADALRLRTAAFKVDAIAVDLEKNEVSISDRRMRARFAARYGAKVTDEARGLRQDDVRAAFNSPFWPFVLASTSVGQEGLDFHPYCHAVVHWNLPSNPVDLEQREGRVHRYKGHAVRKNVVQLHGDSARSDADVDPWAAMFRAAMHARPSDASDLVPFWVLPAQNGAMIERHVPALPLSRDSSRADALRRALAIYRLAFGQARQEDLIQYLLQRIPKDAIDAVAAELRVDLSPRTKAAPLDMSTADADRVERRVEELSDEDSWTVPEEYGLAVLTLDGVADLLDEFSSRCAVRNPAAVADSYRELLDALARCRVGV